MYLEVDGSSDELMYTIVQNSVTAVTVGCVNGWILAILGEFSQYRNSNQLLYRNEGEKFPAFGPGYGHW